MTNPNNLKELSESLTEILDTEVIPELLAKLSEDDRVKLCKLKYRWSLGQEVIGDIKDILNKAKKPRKYSDKTTNYLQQKYGNQY